MPKPLTIEILKKLVSFDTTSCRSNLQLMGFIQDYLKDHGVKSELIFGQTDSKANLFATIGPADKPGVMLSGHTDTVPTSGQEWTKPAYQLTEEDGKFYGRGTTDMKGFIATVLASVPLLTERMLHTPVHLAFSFDEEIGCVGVRSLVDQLKTQPFRPALCIVGEPTSMQITRAHKGKIAAHVRVIGKECHSGMPHLGVNAINFATELVVWLSKQSEHRREYGPFNSDYEVPFTTIHTGVIQGGSTLNIVPNLCEFDFEIRNIAEEDPLEIMDLFAQLAKELSDVMKEVDSACGIEIHTIANYPGLSTGMNEAVVEFVQRLINQSGESKIGFGTEAGLFSDAGIPTVVCGPGSMDQGHKADEYIEATQLEMSEAFVEDLTNYLSV